MTEPEGLGPQVESQLRLALDRVQPRYSMPRYQDAPAAPRRWSAAQAILAAGLAGLMIVTLLAAATSRSLDLQHRIVNTIQSATQPTSTPETAPSPSPEAQQPVPPSDEPTPSPTPKETPEPSQRPQPSDSPEPSDDHSGSTWASPTPTDH